MQKFVVGFLLLCSLLCLHACPEPPDVTTDAGESLREVRKDASAEPVPESSPEVWDVVDYQRDASVPTAMQLPAPPATAIPLPTSTREFDTKHFSGSALCSLCHDDLRDQQGKDVSIVKAWSSSMMALASRDPFWLAQVEHEIKLQPALKSVIEEKCTRCHAPMAAIELQKQKKPVVLFGDKGVLHSSHAFFNPAMSGVSCTLCHQIKDTPQLGTLAGISGKFVVETFASKVNRKVYGPYMDSPTEPMLSNAVFRPTGSKHVKTSKFCASCHGLKTPFVDAKGKIVPKQEKDYFPEQMAFEEWKHSNFGKTGTNYRPCQSCHMASATGVKVSFGPPWLKARDYFRQHIFVGGNRFMLELMRDNKTMLGIQAKNFDFTLKKTVELLQSSASLNLMEYSFHGGTLRFRVQVRSNTGHKLPTGYPSRRMFVQVRVKNEQGKVLFESGKVLKEGFILGVDADKDPTVFEPHYDTITKPDQVQVYEAIMGNTDDKVTYSLLRAAKYLKDNRLLPIGFDKKSASKDIRVMGKAAGDANFMGGSDIVTYKIPGLPKGKLLVEVNLMYQSISFGTAHNLFKGSKGVQTQRFLLLYKRAKRYVDKITSVNFSL